MGGQRNNRQRARQTVRSRDGDLCWLCDEPIDFTLPEGDGMCASLDHVIPQSAGGTWRLSNLRLAHKTCNGLRGAGWGDDEYARHVSADCLGHRARVVVSRRAPASGAAALLARLRAS